MKALITSWVVLFFWIGGYFIWDYSQFHSIVSPHLETFFPRKEIMWDNFLESYSFRIASPTKCSEECCFRFHLLRWRLDHAGLMISC